MKPVIESPFAVLAIMMATIGLMALLAGIYERWANRRWHRHVRKHVLPPPEHVSQHDSQARFEGLWRV